MSNILLLKIIKNSFIYTIVLFGIHKYIQYHFFKEIELFHPIYSVYIYLFLSVIVMFYYIVKAYKMTPDKIFVTFAVSSFVQSAGVVLFFIPLFFTETKSINLTVFNFFVPYFLFVFYEIYEINRLSKQTK